MLEFALSNRLSGGTNHSNSPLIVLSDTLLQSSLLLTREFIHSALAPPSPASAPAQAKTGGQHVVLICAEHPPHKLLPPPGSYDPSRVTVLDCSLPSSTYAPVASTSTSPPAFSSHSTLDLTEPGAREDLERLAVEAAERGGKGGEGVLVVLDSANALAEELEGAVGAVGRVVKGVLKGLKGKKGSRLLVIHHDDLPPPPACPFSSAAPHTAFLQPSLLRTLLSPTLSPSTLHLTLRPSAHIELLSRDYGLAIPLPSLSSISLSLTGEDEEEEPDLRLGQFLASLAQRAVGDPFVRPEKAGEEDERVPLDVLGAGAAALVASSSSSRGGGGGKGGRPTRSGLSAGGAGVGAGGGCVVEWSARGVDILPPPASASSSTNPIGAGRGKSPAALAREKERERAARGEVKKVVRWGFEGVKAFVREGGQGVGVREVRLTEVLERGRMGARGKVGGQVSPLPTPSPAAQPSQSSASSSSSAPPSAPQPLPFSLSLTPSQLAARSLVSNPFHGADKPIYGEEGYRAPSLPGQSAAGSLGAGGAGGTGGGRVEYTADEGDDADWDDPDEDLEI